MKTKVIVAFLQNMWFKDPERAKDLLKKYEEREENGRETFIRDFLFFGCLTGQRLLKAFGDDFRWQCIWEEISLEIGGKSSHAGKPDPVHIRNVLEKHKPEIVLCFGKPAGKAVYKVAQEVPWTIDMIFTCHPAARGSNTVKELAQAANKVKEWMKSS